MTDQSRRYAISIFQPNTFPDPSCSVYASAPFKFIVEGEPFYIHADLVSLHSKPLDRMMNGPVAEGQQGFATLEDLDKGTFVRFIEWAHKGYYAAAKHTVVELESPFTLGSDNHDEVVRCIDGMTPPAEPEQDLSVDFLPSRQPKKGKKAKIHLSDGWGNDAWGFNGEVRKEGAEEMKEELKKAFFGRIYTVRQSVFEIPPPRPNEKPNEDYTDVFLSHAQLYVFAEKYNIQSLKILALEELHMTLDIYTLYHVRTGDIIALLQYVYANTGKSIERVEDMRALMTQYVGYKMEILMEDREFGDLMIVDGGPLMRDFMTMVAKRISFKG